MPSTSGTVARTVITTAKLIEHAVRRCGLAPTSITSETVETANQALFLLMLALANRGLNLWCVETNYLGLKRGKATYVLPEGTIDLLSLALSNPQLIPNDGVQSGLDFISDAGKDVNCLRIGVKFNSISPSDTVTISVSNVVNQTINKTNWMPDEWYWFPFDPIVSARYFKISTLLPNSVAQVSLVSSLFDMELIRWNRDDYMNIPNKQTMSATPTNYYYERKLTPQVTLWQVPNNDDKHLTLIRHRQIQDVGTLTQSIELPTRWLEAIIWQLASRLCFEMPNVPPERVQLVEAKCTQTLAEVEMEETDGANIRLSPMIGGYTK